jgi:hypothetical protein
MNWPFVVGVATAVFVGANIDGSSTGAAFGPATGSDVLSMRLASGLWPSSCCSAGSPRHEHGGRGVTRRRSRQRTADERRPIA